MSNPHKCRYTNNNEWRHCPVCGGRSHLDECTSKRKPGVDCLVDERHTPEEYLAAGFENDGYINGVHIKNL